MQNPITKLRESSTISEKPGYLSENFDELQLPQSGIFCWNFAHFSYLTMSTKGCSRFFLLCLDFELLIKNVKNECVETWVF